MRSFKTLNSLIKLQPQFVGREIGIEIEVEGDNLPRVNKYWRKEDDGSLRGESAEYVLTEPVSRDHSHNVLNYLFNRFKLNKTKLIDSGRAGVHIHVNVSDLPINSIFNFACLYLILEPLYVNYCGKSRVGNLFCLRASDAEGVVDYVQSVLNGGRIQHLKSDNIRYASLNFKSLITYGSLEFRAMKSPATRDEIETWIELLLQLKDSSAKYELPTDIYHELSIKGIEGFAKEILGDYFDILTRGVKGWRDQVEESMRITQDIAFGVNWEAYLDKKGANPFDAAVAPVNINWAADVAIRGVEREVLIKAAMGGFDNNIHQPARVVVPKMEINWEAVRDNEEDEEEN